MTTKPYSRSQRYGHELQKILGEIILKEVDTSGIGFVTVTGVKVSRDLKHAHVYVSVLERTVGREFVESFFRRNAKSIRRILGSRITSKSVPEVRFFYDETFEEAEKLNRLFAKIHHSGPVSE
ncbi:MAG: 30S ribosome-binding factor RbfA [Fidelibacterota bacterium]